MLWIWVVGFVIAFLVLILLISHARFRSNKARCKKQLDEFNSHLTEMLDQIEALQKRHQFLPYSDDDFSQPMTGHTLALYNEFDRTLERFRDTWLKLTELQETVESGLRTVRYPALRKLHEMSKLLDQSNFGTTSALQQQCEETLKRLEQAHEQAKQVQGNVARLIEQIADSLSTLTAENLSRTPYEADLTAMQNRSNQASSVLSANPLGTQKEFAGILSTATALLERITKILEQAVAVENVLEQLSEIEKLAERRRAEGMFLIEEKGNPDPMIAEGRNAHADCRRELNQGDVHEADTHLKHALRCSEDARNAIEKQVEAKAFCEQHLHACGKRTVELQQALTRCQQEHSQLQNEFAPESWHDVAGHTERAEAMLGGLEKMLAEAQSASQPDVQHYFRAAQVLRDVQRHHQNITQLCRAVSDRVQSLSALRERCRGRVAQLEEQAQETHSWLSEHANSIGPEAYKWHDLAKERLHDWQINFNQPRPNWNTLWNVQDRVAQALATSMEHGKQDVEHHQQFRAELDAVQSFANTVQMMLRSHFADRPRANRRWDRASAELANLHSASASRGDWQDLLRRVGEVAADLRKAESLAKEDIRLAHQAEAEIAEAEREIARARSFYREGISSDVHTAEGQLRIARQEYSAQQYETAIEAADRAEQLARQAHYQAEQEANERLQMRQMAHIQSSDAMEMAAYESFDSDVAWKKKTAEYESTDSDAAWKKEEAASSYPDKAERELNDPYMEEYEDEWQAKKKM